MIVTVRTQPALKNYLVLADMANPKDRISSSSKSPDGIQSNVGLTSTGSRNLQHGPIRLLRLAQVLDVTGLGKTKIYELQSEGSFPMRVQITDHSVGWIEDEVQAWLTKRVAASVSLPRHVDQGNLKRLLR